MIAEFYCKPDFQLNGCPSDTVSFDYNKYESAWERWLNSFLRGEKPVYNSKPTNTISIADLFCGCGGLTLGVVESLRANGLEPVVRFGLDTDRRALEVYARNFSPLRTICADIGTVVDYKTTDTDDGIRFAYRPEIVDPVVAEFRGGIDILLAGPPCQGYSNLNNHTRCKDPRNLLYLDAVALAVALDARAVVIENVPEVVGDVFGVFHTAIELLRSSGYETTHAVLSGTDLGLPQTRRRMFLVASRNGVRDLGEVARSFYKPPVDLRAAIGDLEDADADPIMDAPANLSPENRKRIDYLFDNDLYDLPNHMRPACHRNGHTYNAVYGRLRWDAPAGTITTGFMTPGRGRFVHPSRRRTLTPHEAARIQGFPDWFEFHFEGFRPTRGELAKWIGNAVPPIFGYVAVMAILAVQECRTMNEANDDTRLKVSHSDYTGTI
jgi:DNA (cytosine-5)-methyltransferase 1